MVRAIDSLLNNPELVQRVSSNGRKLAEKSGWTAVRKDLESLFAEVLNKKQLGKSKSLIEIIH